jgi:hypothetical protein
VLAEIILLVLTADLILGLNERNRTVLENREAGILGL